MHTKESIKEYCRLAGRQWPAASHIAAYRIAASASLASSFPHVRRDFYKVKLLRQADGILHYGDQQAAIKGDALIFVNPHLPYSWQQVGGPHTGYTCLFTEQFITPHLKTASVAYSPLFRAGSVPVLLLPPALADRLSQLFEQLLAELNSEYAGRYELASSYLHLLLHEALKLRPVPARALGPAAARLSAQFLALLERQFPMASPRHSLGLRNAGEYARQLGVHPNHLNKALKEATGQTTTQHLAGRLADEARALLHHSNWTLAEIGYCLGFEHPANFAVFFKKQAGQPPQAYRRQALANSTAIT
ncbi:MAG: helix-turn-helix domain-containing protein [Janthinobacterium lividum]